jgi:ABC-type uncharacterized transport system substrate-binding protein
MMKLIKNLWLAVVLILSAILVLLLSDLEQRQGSRDRSARAFRQIAIMQIASNPLLDTHVSGVIDRLTEQGHIAPDRSNLRMYNPQGDLGMANVIAREIVNGPYELVITSSTLALQIFAKANQHSGKLHVFGGVTDPYGTGVGITGKEPHQHPPYLAGVGTFQPVKTAFRILKQLNPRIRKVGVVWNPGEQCSEACLREAREICAELNVELVEAVAVNTSEVSEAARSLLARGVEAVWIGGDTVAISSLGLIVSIAGQSGIPVFTNDPSDIAGGALFGMGADYYQVGQITADVAASILEGRSPAELRIENIVPEVLTLNDALLSKLGPAWSVTESVQERLNQQQTADQAKGDTIDFAVMVKNSQPPDVSVLRNAAAYRNLHARYGRPARLAIITLVENPALEQAVEGVRQALLEAGILTGKDVEIKMYSAQGDPSILSQISNAVLQDKPDAVVTLTTQAMMAVTRQIKTVPVIFTVASDPVRLGLFKEGRPANICGFYDNPPVDKVLDMILKHIPDVQSVGTLYDPSQMNSVFSVEKLRAAGKERSIKIIEVTASVPSDLPMAAKSLIQRGAKAIVLSSDNLVSTGFAPIRKAATDAGIPVFVTDMELIGQGADGGIGDSFFEWGRQSGQLAAQVLAGVPPSVLPVEATKNHQIVEPGVTFRPNKKGVPFRLRMVQYSETEFAERCHEGLIDGIRKSGMQEGRDFELKLYNAQGDMSTLSSIMSAVKSDRPDLLMVISTPTLQAALRQAGPDIRIVFTGVGDAVKAGAGTSNTDHLPNVTGITTQSSFTGMAQLIRETLPATKRVGTLFTPAEINSVFYKDQFAAALSAEGIELITVPVTTSADVPQAAAELCRKDIQVLAQVVDNLTRPGFALISRKAAEQNIPVFVFDSDQMKDGAVMCMARDYYDAGLEAAQKAIRVLNGENPAAIPFSNTKSEKLMIHPQLAAKYRLQLSPELRGKAIDFTKL